MKLKPLLTILMIFCWSFFINSQGYVEIQKRVASDRNSNAYFGESLVLTNDYLFVGASGNDSIASNSGAVYLFKKMAGQWEESTIITNTGLNFNDQFGNALAFENDKLYIASFYHDVGPIPANGGSVFIYENQAGIWTYLQSIVSDDIQATDLFGTSLAVSGDYIAVGAPRHDYDINEENFISESGAVYIFKNQGSNNWSQIAKLVAPTRSAQERFGYSVAIQGNDLLIGAYRDDEDENEMGFVDDAGAAYYYRNDGSDNFNLIQKIVASDRGLNDAGFGENLILDNDRLFVKGKTVNNLGGVYAFTKSLGIWVEQQIIENPETLSIVSNSFGLALDVEGERLIVGSINEENNSNVAAGMVHYYKEIAGVWTFMQKITATNTQSSDLFGYAVAMNNDELIVGAKQHDFDVDNGNEINNAGAVYAFNFDEDLVLSIVENNRLSEIKVYPNPTNKNISILLGNNYENVLISVANALGQEIFKNLYHSTNRVLLNLPKKTGIYFVSISTKQGKLTTIKILKK